MVLPTSYSRGAQRLLVNVGRLGEAYNYQLEKLCRACSSFPCASSTYDQATTREATWSSNLSLLFV
jgi:hypothetical protein